MIYSALIVRHNLEALGKGCGLFNINQNVSIYQRHCLKVRVWSTLNKILTPSQIKRFSLPSNTEQKFNTMSWTNHRISSDMKLMYHISIGTFLATLRTPINLFKGKIYEISGSQHTQKSNNRKEMGVKKMNPTGKGNGKRRQGNLTKISTCCS